MKESLQKQFISERDSIHRHEEKGVALIFTLCILVLLTMLAMAFVTLSQTNKKLASVHTDATLTKLFAESAIERVIGSIQLYNDNIDSGRIYPGTNSFFFIKSANSNTGSTDSGWDNRNVIFSFQSGGDTDWAHHFKTQFALVDGTTMRDYLGWYGTDSSAFKSALPASWKYFTTNDGTTDKILGRISYIIIDESGKIDPNKVTVSGTNEATWESRKGSNVDELNLQGAGLTSASATALGYDNAGGKRPSNAKWFSWSHIIGGDTGFSQNEVDSYTGSLFPYSYDIEACWIDTNGNTKYDSGEDYHRFNLTRNDWDSLTLSDILNDPASFTLSAKTHDGDGIKWLNDFSEKGEFASVSARKNQLAANLLDYCDTDSIPKTDSDGSTPPTYLGLEQTAYLNEIHVQIHQTPVTKVAVSGGVKYSWPVVNIDITPEIVNVYSNQVSACSLELKYEINGTVNDGHLVSYTLKSITPSGPVDGLEGTLTYNFGATNAKSFQTIVAQQVSFMLGDYETPDEGKPVNLTINDITITAYLKDGNGNLIDYSTITTSVAPVDLNIHSSEKFANYQTNDPRHNQFVGQWTANSGDLDVGTLTTTNSTCKPGLLGDKEAGTNPWVSTCYIRNGVIESPWELGAIHRGAAWETINLKAYNNGAIGGGSYADGDANILDQIKMNGNTANSGKININTPVKDVLKALVRNIYVGESYVAPGGTSGAIISSLFAEDIANGILNLNGAKGGNTYTSRAAVADVGILTDNSLDGGSLDQITDAKKEEIIGKFINLTTVRQNLFTLIILAQTIRDAGNPSGSATGVPLYIDLDLDGDFEGSVSEVSAGWDIDGKDTNNNGNPNDDPVISDKNLDADSNPETVKAKMGRYDQYVDTITTEQKILVVVYRDAYTNKCRILHFEYLAD